MSFKSAEFKFCVNVTSGTLIVNIPCLLWKWAWLRGGMHLFYLNWSINFTKWHQVYSPVCTYIFGARFRQLKKYTSSAEAFPNPLSQLTEDEDIYAAAVQADTAKVSLQFAVLAHWLLNPSELFWSWTFVGVAQLSVSPVSTYPEDTRVFSWSFACKHINHPIILSFIPSLAAYFLFS